MSQSDGTGVRSLAWSPGGRTPPLHDALVVVVAFTGRVVAFGRPSGRPDGRCDRSPPDGRPGRSGRPRGRAGDQPPAWRAATLAADQATRPCRAARGTTDQGPGQQTGPDADAGACTQRRCSAFVALVTLQSVTVVVVVPFGRAQLVRAEQIGWAARAARIVVGQRALFQLGPVG